MSGLSNQRVHDMKETSVLDFLKEEDGAAFIEYTALLGVILAVGIVVLSVVGNWANNRWSMLNSQISGT